MAKKTLITNPFSVISYLGEEYFCDRVQETKELFESLKNGRNITLISPRRMGKTGLIKHVFAQNSAENAFFFYIDIYDTTSLASFTKTFAESVFSQQIGSATSRVWKDLSRIFASIRPIITIDQLTGQPQCQVDIKPQTEAATLQQIFAYLESAHKPCYVAFDEFQVVADYEDCQMEAVLRKHIQHLTNVHFIFAGSKKHIMTEMFLSPNRPFYQSTQMTDIYEIEEGAYWQFANYHFAKHKQHISEATFHELYALVKGHTWYIQSLLNRLYQQGTKEIEYSHVLLALSNILEEYSSSYQTYLQLLPTKQRMLLYAIAKEGCVREINSRAFLEQYNLGAASSVQGAITPLVEKELVYERNGEYMVYDRFFSLWLAM